MDRLEPAPPPGSDGEAREPTRGLLRMRLGAARFGVWMDEVLEVVRTPPISRLPVAAREVAGVTSVRGDVVPVLDLGVRILDEPVGRPGRILLVRAPDGAGMLGLLVDDVETLLDVPASEVREPPAGGAGVAPGFVEGVINRPDGVVTVLRLDAATAPPAQFETEE